jgi:L-threonylcarbamoyladenylate synthase
MQTTLLSIDDADALTAVEVVLSRDDIFAAPTDTVYGLFCRYDSPAAIARLYIAKDRPPQKAIPILIGTPEHLDTLVQLPLPLQAQPLMARFWPGPLTLVFPAQPHLPTELTAGASTVAVRMPNHAALRHILCATGPLAATSANRSGGPETHTAQAVLDQLAGRIFLVLADTAVEAPPQPALASTIVDLSAREAHAPARILREGPLGEAVRALLANMPHEVEPGHDG